MPRKNLYFQADLMLQEYAGMHQLRITNERRKILRYIVDHRGSFTAADVVGWVKSDYISQATVYNTLSLLEQAHIVQVLHKQFNGRVLEYECALGESSSMQIICTQCGRISKVKDKPTDVAIKMKQYPNFIMRHYSVYVFGECKKCKLN